MRVTIHSDEPLADVLRVVSSMYGVALTTADNTVVPAEVKRTSKRASSTRSTTTEQRTRARGSSASTDILDPKLVRQWAWENGYDVNTRGSLPAAVREAYRAANPN